MHQAPIFLSSVRYGREVTTALEQFGYAVIRSDAPDIARAYRSSKAFIAVIDARGALESGVAQVRDIADIVMKRRGGLLVLLSRNDTGALACVHDAGATHYLVSPFGQDEFGTTLKFVERSIRRMRASGTEAAMAQAQAVLAESATWRWQNGADEIELSPDLSDMLGLSRQFNRLPVADAFAKLAPRQAAKTKRAIRSFIKNGMVGEIEHDIMIEGASHRIIHHVRPLLGEGGQLTGLSATVEDIDAATVQHRLSVHYDSLTGLASLTNVRARLDDVLSAKRDAEPAAIAALIGISRLDQVNAAHGRVIADSLLQAVGRRLKRLTEERGLRNTVIARLGGAEFAVVFLGPVMLNQAVFFSQMATKIFERPFVIDGRVIHLACRIGIAASEEAMSRGDELLHRASSALAQAKENDPNSFQVYFSGRSDDPARLASLEQVVREAARDGALDIRYQPQVDVIDGRIAGVEALVRYEHPLYGSLPAETLLATAERAEFSVELGRNIMRQACREAAAWPPSMDQLRLSVNVTAGDMRDRDFVPNMLSILSDTGFPAERLTLEITEGGLVENLERTADMLSDVRSRKIRVAIDDFGTGYSSLAYLKSLPLDYLKIDKTIAADIEGEVRDKIIVRGVVDMARSLGMTVIAEGVETHGQLDLLVREGCNWYQGFLCSEALSSRELQAFMSAWESQGSRALTDA
ncbi:MAG: EAL domain-containing protein [Pacificimonas sp.]